MPAERLSERVWALTGPTNIGFLSGPGGRAVVVDTGLDESAARKALRFLAEAGLRPVAVFNTHSHADHIGGNRSIVERTGAVVHASAFEAAVVRHPVWEPIYLAGGALPGPAARTKFFMADPTPTVVELPTDGEFELADGFPVRVVPLPGHAYGQVGLAYDGVLFTADAFLPPAVLEKHGLPFTVDVAAAEETLARLEREADEWNTFLPGHGPSLDRTGLLRETSVNRATFDRLRLIVHGALDRPRSTDELLEAIAGKLGLAFGNPGQYYLARATTTALVTDLERRGLVSVVVDGALPRWAANRG